MRPFGKITRKELIFLLAWAIFTCTIIIGVTFLKFQSGYAPIETIVKYIRLLSYGMCIIVILQRFYARSMIINVVVAAGIVLLSTLLSHNTVMIWCILFIIAAIGIDADKICWVSLLTRAIMMFGTIALTQIGVIEDYIFSVTTRARHGLGFDWATTGPILFFFLTLIYIYLRREQLEWLELVVIEAGHLFFYKLTDTRMTFLIGTLSVVIFLCSILVKKKWYITKRLGYAVCIAPALVGILAVLLHVLYNEKNAIWTRLNGIMSGRLKLGYDAFHEYGLTLFGQNIEWVGFGIDESGIGYNYVDCSYLQYLLEYGVVFLAFVLAVYTILIYRAVKHEDYCLVWVCLITLVFCITEPWLFNFTFNPIPVLVFANIKDRNTKKDGVLTHEQKYKDCYSNTQRV